MMSLSNTHIVEPTSKHTHTVIFLHGRDSTPDEFAPEFFESQASDDRTLLEIFPSFKWVFPASKIRKSARFETEISQWFDMWSVENPEERNELQVKGLRESVVFILEVITAEAALVPNYCIILGGISQGCATAISALLCSGIQIGGFVGLCSWLPFERKIVNDGKSIQEVLQFPDTLDHEVPLKTPVFLSHSKDDDVVLIQNGKRLACGLEHLGMNVVWKEYEDGGHWINEPKGIDDIVEFIRSNNIDSATLESMRVAR